MEELHYGHSEDHGYNDPEDGDIGGVFADTFHLHQADFQPDEKEQDQNRQARNDVDEGIDGDVGLSLWAREQVRQGLTMGTRGENLLRSLRQVVWTGERHRRDFREIVALAKDGEGGVPEVIAEISGEQPNEQLTEDRGLLDPLHQPAAKGRPHGDENRGDQDRDDRVGMRQFTAFGKRSEQQRPPDKLRQNSSNEHLGTPGKRQAASLSGRRRLYFGGEGARKQEQSGRGGRHATM